MYMLTDSNNYCFQKYCNYNSKNHFTLHNSLICDLKVYFIVVVILHLNMLNCYYYLTNYNTVKHWYFTI